MRLLVKKKVEQVADDLLSLEGMDSDILHALADSGINTQEDLADLAADDLIEITGIDADRANQLIMKTREPWFA